MKLNLYIKMHGPAFAENPSREAARIFRELADRINNHPHFSEGHSQPLTTEDGKEVGYWGLHANEWQDEPGAVEPANELIAEWVGLHYQLHWESLPVTRQNEFRERYIETHLTN